MNWTIANTVVFIIATSYDCYYCFTRTLDFFIAFSGSFRFSLFFSHFPSMPNTKQPKTINSHNRNYSRDLSAHTYWWHNIHFECLSFVWFGEMKEKPDSCKFNSRMMLCYCAYFFLKSNSTVSENEKYRIHLLIRIVHETLILVHEMQKMISKTKHKMSKHSKQTAHMLSYDRWEKSHGERSKSTQDFHFPII